MYLISEVGIKNAFSFKSTTSILLLGQLTSARPKKAVSKDGHFWVFPIQK
jgi:hypothetical protein